MTKLIYLIGNPGTGKYTIAKEIAKSGYKIADNQLVNYPIFALLDYDGITPIPQVAWVKIEKIRDAVLEFIALELNNNYVLTNCLMEEDYDHKLYNQVKETAATRGSIFIPIKLCISKEENGRRIKNPERLLRYKALATTEWNNKAMIKINHPNLLELDVTKLSAVKAAEEILRFVNNITNYS